MHPNTPLFVKVQMKIKDDRCLLRSKVVFSFLSKKTIVIERTSRWPSGLEHWTADQVVLGPNPAMAASLRNFGNSVYPALPVSFGGDTKGRRSFLSGVYVSGSKRSHQSALEMCNLLWTPPLLEKDNSKTTLCIILKCDCFTVSKGKERNSDNFTEHTDQCT